MFDKELALVFDSEQLPVHGRAEAVGEGEVVRSHVEVLFSIAVENAVGDAEGYNPILHLTLSTITLKSLLVHYLALFRHDLLIFRVKNQDQFLEDEQVGLDGRRALGVVEG